GARVRGAGVRAARSFLLRRGVLVDLGRTLVGDNGLGVIVELLVLLLALAQQGEGALFVFLRHVHPDVAERADVRRQDAGVGMLHARGNPLVLQESGDQLRFVGVGRAGDLHQRGAVFGLDRPDRRFISHGSFSYRRSVIVPPRSVKVPIFAQNRPPRRKRSSSA